MKASLDTLAPTLVAAILREVPDAQALYAFGSQARGDANAVSDLDLAILAPHPVPPLTRFDLAGELAAIAGCDVDLVDLRSATTVMRAQVYRSDLLLHEGDRHARQWFEMLALSDYARLNEERRAILADVHARGKVFG
jgi:predicted nucleotidyltransferase